MNGAAGAPVAAGGGPGTASQPLGAGGGGPRTRAGGEPSRYEDLPQPPFCGGRLEVVGKTGGADIPVHLPVRGECGSAKPTGCHPTPVMLTAPGYWNRGCLAIRKAGKHAPVSQNPVNAESLREEFVRTPSVRLPAKPGNLFPLRLPKIQSPSHAITSKHWKANLHPIRSFNAFQPSPQTAHPQRLQSPTTLLLPELTRNNTFHDGTNTLLGQNRFPAPFPI